MDRNKVQSILQEAVENPDLARQNLIRLQNAWGEVIESLGGPDKALPVGSQPVAANEHHAILAFESNFNAGQTMKRDNLNTMFGNISVRQQVFHPKFCISMEGKRFVQPFLPKLNLCPKERLKRRGTVSQRDLNLWLTK